MAKYCKITSCLVVQKLVRTKKVIKVGGISGKDGILTVKEKPISLIGNKAKRSHEMTTW